MIPGLGSHRRTVEAPSTEGRTTMAAAAAQALRRVRQEGGFTVEEAVANAAQQLAVYESRQPETPAKEPTHAGLIDWSKLYNRSPQIDTTRDFEFHDTVRRISPARWRALESGSHKLSPFGIRDAVGLAVGNPREHGDANYRGVVTIWKSHLPPALMALETLVSTNDRRGRRILEQMGIVGVLMLDHVGWDIEDAGKLRKFNTLTGVAEFDQGILQTLAPWVRPSSRLECRLGDRYWHFRFRDGQAVRDEGRDPHMKWYEQIFDKATEGLPLPHPELFHRDLSKAINDAALEIVGKHATEAALADCADRVIEFLANPRKKEQKELDRKAVMRGLRRAAGTCVPKKLLMPSEVLVASADGGALARGLSGKPGFTLV